MPYQMKEATKLAYVSPPEGELTITLIRDANPRVSILLDLGIPNFTVFSMTLPLAEGQPKEMSGLIAEGVHVLLDEVATFMMSMEYEEKVIVNMYAQVLATFKTMSGESDPQREQDPAGQDPTIKSFEGTFAIPMDFINETQKRVVTAKKIERPVKVRHVQLTYSPKEKIKPSDTARVIRQYRNRSLKQQPKPLYVIVYDQMGRATGTIPIGPGKNFKNELLKAMKKASVDFSAPVSFVSEQEMKSKPLDGIPRAISVGGMTYQPEAISGGDMALYHGPQDYIVKFPDGRSQVFPGRPTFRKMRTLNFPVPKNRYKWTMIPEEALQQQEAPAGEPQEAPVEEIKEAAEPVQQAAPAPAPVPEEPAQEKSPYNVTPDQVAEAHDMYGGSKKLVKLKPNKTVDDLVSLDVLQKRLQRDKVQGQIFEGLMTIDRVGYWGTYEGKPALIISQYYVRRYGVRLSDGTFRVYHKRRDGKAERVGLRPQTAEQFLEAKPVESGIETKGSL
jgi:hypothetical protein